MYHSNPLYTGNLTAGIHIHNMVQFGKDFPQIYFYLLVRTLWHLYKTSKIRVVRGELGANSTSLWHR